MPTIDQLAPAAAASDTDEIMISQNGVSRKISRAALIAGLQPQIATLPGTLLGNPGAGASGPAEIKIGSNLTLNGGTLSAAAAPYVVTSLPAGNVPNPGDLIPVAQSGTDAAVSYSQFMNGLSAVANIDISKLLVTPTGSGAGMKIADFAANAVLTTGGTMTGSLILSTDPSQPSQAATKQYVDSVNATSLPKTGGALTGPLMLATPPTQPLQAATKNYVDSQTAGLLPKSGGIVIGPLTLSGDPAQPLDAATRRYVDAGNANTSFAVAAETQARTAGDNALQAMVTTAQSNASSAQVSASAAQTSAGTALTTASAAQATAASALSSATAAQKLASSALPVAGGNLNGNLSIPSSYLYAGTDDFSAVRAQGRPTDGKAMLYVNRVGSSGTDPSLISSYYYVNDAGGTGSPRLVNNLQANIVSTPVSGIWLTHLGVTSAAVGGNQGLNGHLAADLQAVRDVSTPIGNTTIQTPLSTPSQIVTVADLTNFGQAPVTGGANVGTLTSIVNTAPLSTVTTATAPGGAQMLTVGSTSGFTPGMFCWGLNFAGYITAVTSNSITLGNSVQTSIGSGSAVSAGWALLVKIGGSFYHLVSVTAANGPGSMTLGEPVAVIDARAGGPVVAAQGGAPLWSFVAEIQEHTNLSSSASGFAQIGELDIAGNGDDDGPNAFVYIPAVGANIPQGGRCFLSFVGSKYNASGPDFVMNTGLAFTTGSGASINSVILPNVRFNSALIDARKAVASSSSSNAIWLADGHRIAFSTDGTVGMACDPSSGMLRVTGQVRFGSPPALPSYLVAALPASPSGGAKAYTSNGRKQGEAAGAGSGVEVFADSTGRWISVLSGSPVQA